MAKLVDAADLKSVDSQDSWGFNSPSGDHEVQMTKIDIEYLKKLRNAVTYDSMEARIIEVLVNFYEDRGNASYYDRRQISNVIDWMSIDRQRQVLEILNDELNDRIMAAYRRLNEPEGMIIGIWTVDMADGKIDNGRLHPKNNHGFPGKIEFAHRDKTGKIQILEIVDQRVGTSGEMIKFHRSAMSEIHYRTHCVIINDDDFMFTADDKLTNMVLVTRVWPYRGG